MTAQIIDLLIHDGTTYGLGMYEGTGLFDPADEGLKAVGWSTACSDGFHCVYEVRDQSLYLSTLYIGLKPEIVESMQRGDHPAVFGKIPRRYAEDFWHGESPDYIVDDLNEFIPYSGGLLIGHLSNFEFNQPFHQWFGLREYDVVLELVFDGGRLVETYDRSQAIAEEYKRKFEGQKNLTDSERAERVNWLKRNFAVEYSQLMFAYTRQWPKSDKASS